MKKNNDYIELVHETGWKHPIQAYAKTKVHGKWDIYHFFMEWDTFSEAIKILKRCHSCPIIVNKQKRIGLSVNILKY